MASSGHNLDLRASSSTAVANQLRSELLSGAIPPGARILPAEIAERFSVSHIPVREALRRLEAEGLVITSPQRATYAADVTLDDLAGLYELRRVVEGEFAWRSVRVAGDADVRRVVDQWNALEGCVAFSEDFYARHREFHWALLAPAASEVTHRVLARLWVSVDRYLALALTRLDSFSQDVHYEETMVEHRKLKEAFQARDPDSLRNHLSTHLTRTEDRLREAYRELLSDGRGASRWLAGESTST
jgi:DNA-binding GntR family transcriptional regulator